MADWAIEGILDATTDGADHGSATGHPAAARNPARSRWTPIPPLADRDAIQVGDTLPAAGLDAAWRRSTEAGNRAFAQGDVAAAARCYRESLAEAERLFDLARDAGGMPALLAPMLHTISCHHAADAMARQGNAAGACAHRVCAVEALVAAAASAASPLALRVSCVRHMRYALAFLAGQADQPDAGDREAAIVREELAARARTVSAEVIRIAGHMLASDRRAGTAGPAKGDGMSPRAYARS